MTLGYAVDAARCLQRLSKQAKKANNKRSITTAIHTWNTTTTRDNRDKSWLIALRPWFLGRSSKNGRNGFDTKNYGWDASIFCRRSSRSSQSGLGHQIPWSKACKEKVLQYQQSERNNCNKPFCARHLTEKHNIASWHMLTFPTPLWVIWKSTIFHPVPIHSL